MRCTVTPKQLQRWCLYTITTDNDMLLYAGVSTLQSVLHLDEARANSAMVKVFNSDTTLHIETHASYATAAEAITAQRSYIALHAPICNIQGTTITPNNRRTAVLCVTTGERYDTAAAACKAHNISTASMSYHLNRKPGHRTCAGLVFERIE